MKDSSVLKRFLLLGVVVASSFFTLGSEAAKDETVSPEAIPTITPSDRNSAGPGVGAKNSPQGGKPMKPAN